MSKNSAAQVELDRRAKSERRSNERRKQTVPVPAERRQTGERRVKVQRRRQIDPTTCERDYSDDEIQFMQALDAYKRTSGRMFPTCSEILEVIRAMGYVRVTSEMPAVEALAAAGAAAVASEDHESEDRDSEDRDSDDDESEDGEDADFENE